MGSVADSFGVTFDEPVHLLNQFVDFGVGKEFAHLPISYGSGRRAKGTSVLSLFFSNREGCVHSPAIE